MFGTTDKSIQKRSIYLNQTHFTVAIHNSKVRCLKILPDGTIASGGEDNNIKISNITNGAVLKTLTGHGNHVLSVDVLWNSLLVSVDADKSIRVWNFTTGLSIKTISDAHVGFIIVVKKLNDCYFATGSEDSTIKVSFSVLFISKHYYS